MAGLLALAAANNFVRRLKCMGKLPAIEQWRGRIGPERAAVYNHPQSVWRHFAPLRRGAGGGTGGSFNLGTPEKSGNCRTILPAI
jgi:hypothetical protein